MPARRSCGRASPVRAWAAADQWLRRASISSPLSIFERPSMPISLARRWRSDFDQSSYFADLPPLEDSDEVFALAIRAAFSFEAPLSRRASYCSSFLIDEP